MTIREEAFFFECAGDTLPAIVAASDVPSSVGAVIVVGGPQYRVGAHRKFVSLARHLAAAGIPCMRFDYRGMGDAWGDFCGFENVGDDIRAAIDAFFKHRPSLERIVLWGLCDGASAACFYAGTDTRVASTVLLNPWVQTEAGEAQIFLKHYYLQRLVDPKFWRKLLGGGVALGQSFGSLFAAFNTRRLKIPGSGSSGVGNSAKALPERVYEGLLQAAKPTLIVLSGRDYVAREFELSMKNWPAASPVHYRVVLEHLPGADHTFSSEASWVKVLALSEQWCKQLV